MGAMANLGYRLSDQTVGNILQRHGIPPAPERKRTTTWTDFIRAHMSVLAGTDIFSVEVLTLRVCVAIGWTPRFCKIELNPLHFQSICESRGVHPIAMDRA